VKKTAAEYDAWMNILAKQKKMGAKVIIAEANLEIRAGDVLIDTLYPLENLEGKDMKNTSNDTGVVSKVIFGNNSFLFTGDISSVAEKEIVNSKENILSDVLKVAHHGSKYSTSDIFLEAAQPKIAVISVGAKNTYGHPTPEVLQRLEKSGIKILRTDINGDINLESDGKNIMLGK
jgi:competence protein ComEC